MVYKNFTLNVILRILVLTISIFLLYFTWFRSKYYTTPILLGILIIYQIYLIIHYVNKVNRDITNFFESIRYSDFNRSFQIDGLGSSFDGLKKAFNNVIQDFQNIRAEKEENHYFFQNVIHHIGISLIAYYRNGEVEMFNNAAKKLFSKANLNNINELKAVSPTLTESLLNIKQGEHDLIKIRDGDDFLQLAIYAREFKLHNQNIILVAIQNIQEELEEKEMEAWQKLIRVLTHEIMNSIAPISSLSSTVNTMIDATKDENGISDPNKIDPETIEDIQNALTTIHKRSNGLIHFVETYRNLTKLPKPNFQIVPIKQIFQNIKLLMDEELKNSNVRLKCKVQPQSLELTVDVELIEQVLINLIKNAHHAIGSRKDGKIEVNAQISERGRISIHVKDNGPGILKDVLDKIFIPFFTTKASGSGIGLSLSRQIVRMHGGTLTAHSDPDNYETVFTMKF
ncbi:MAG: ATP-binding protein [Chlorobi bacterium]|nr:ATP-binding protein [Chlorobiota bacterium]